MISWCYISQILLHSAILTILLSSNLVNGLSREIDETKAEPYFSEPIPNVTISVGRSVSLPCTVENLGHYRVAWIHAGQHTLLTLQNRVISRSDRYKVSQSGHRTWYLHITEVQEKDRGQYMCQINTTPMKTQTGYLDVVVPPQIEEESTSSDIDIREGNEAILKCSAKGYPTPSITWRREDGVQFNIDDQIVHTYKGNQLNFSHVSRQHMGAYLCIASNKIPPSVSKRIMLTVNFSPMIWIPNQLIGAVIGSNAVLDCNLESFPKSITFWTKEHGILIISNKKYDNLLMPSGLYKTHMKLVIKNIEPEDFGSYTCVAKNSLGETAGTIRLYEILPLSSTQVPKSPQTDKLQKDFDMLRKSDTETSLRNVNTNLDIHKLNQRKPINKGSMEAGQSGSDSPKSALLYVEVFPFVFVLLSEIAFA